MSISPGVTKQPAASMTRSALPRFGPDRGDFAVADEQIRPPLQLLRGVEDRAGLDEDCGHKCEYNHEGTKITKTDTKKNYN